MSYSVRNTVIVALVLAVVSGCQVPLTSHETPPQIVRPASPGLFQRGLVSAVGDGQWRFRPCFAHYEWILSDPTERLSRRFSEQLAPTVYGEFSLAPGEDLKHWQVQQVHLLGGGEATCRFSLNEINYRAANGREWVADVLADTIVVQDYARVSRMTFAMASGARPDDLQWRSDLKQRNGEKIQMELTLSQTACSDPYGGEYEFSAKLKLGKRTLSGCARSGNLEQRTLPGVYAADLRMGQGPGRRIELSLLGSGRMELKQTDTQQRSLLFQQGQWSLLKTGKLLVEVQQTNGRPDTELMLFVRDAQGRLALEGYSSSYGENLLRLPLVAPDPEQLWNLGVQ
ncbi:hypothetical protein [Neptuniibacter sp. CAU 1671]|uniref:hypothetical protein n=1 Tax=Neptuniibacter sp. CAU 1671 TaxID=3032593 RepID=UPI0023DA3A9E|nr:hypothetical protein [Neptuniibacter sp. CAU 1671]MDF2181116.1 hypothetical protein [Neptuniibacter sp. CAU 1671]